MRGPLVNANPSPPWAISSRNRPPSKRESHCQIMRSTPPGTLPSPAANAALCVSPDNTGAVFTAPSLPGKRRPVAFPKDDSVGDYRLVDSISCASLTSGETPLPPYTTRAGDRSPALVVSGRRDVSSRQTLWLTRSGDLTHLGTVQVNVIRRNVNLAVQPGQGLVIK